MSTRYTLNGVSSNVEFGLGGPRVKASGAVLQIRNPADSAYAELEVGAPTAPQSATTKTYVDNLINGLAWHEPVVAATITDGPIATAYAAGQSIDGWTLSTGERILLKNQVPATENGIYIVQASGAPVRAADMAAGSGAANSAMFIQSGGQADEAWVCTNDTGSDVVGTDGLTFVQFSASGIPDESITEVKLAPLVGQLVRYVTYAFGDSSPKNIGSTLPTNARVLEVENHVTTAFTDTGATLEVGTSGTPDELQAATENNPAVADSYFTEPGIQYASATQLILTITPGTSTAGAGFVAVRFIHVL